MIRSTWSKQIKLHELLFYSLFFPFSSLFFLFYFCISFFYVRMFFILLFSFYCMFWFYFGWVGFFPRLLFPLLSSSLCGLWLNRGSLFKLGAGLLATGITTFRARIICPSWVLGHNDEERRRDWGSVGGTTKEFPKGKSTWQQAWSSGSLVGLWFSTEYLPKLGSGEQSEEWERGHYE